MVVRKFGQAFIPLVAIATLPATILAAVFLGLQAAAVVGVVGWLLLLPTSAVLYGVLSSTQRAHMDIEPEIADAMMDDMETADPVEKLRQRYAEGDIDEQELERGLDALLETEDVSVDDTERVARAVENIDSDESSVDAAGGGDGRETETSDADRDVELDRN